MPSSQTIVLPAAGQGVRLIVGQAPQPLQLTCTVLSAADDGSLTLRPGRGADPTGLAAGAAVTLEYFKDGAIYQLQSAIVAVRPETGEPPGHRVEVAAPTRSRTVRRRRYPRLDVSMPVRCMRVEMPKDFNAESLRGRWMQSRWSRRLADEGEEAQAAALGAGGARLTTAVLELDDHLYLELDLQADAPVHVAGRVVWVSEPGNPPAAGVEFVGVSDGTRDAIGRFVTARGERDPTLVRR